MQDVQDSQGFELDSQGFGPVVAGRPEVLILGSLPGRRSLEEGQYYAQPQNAFWRIMGELYGAHPRLPYEDRKQRLTRHGVALWDVLASAHRPGSLDSSIVKSTMIVNDFDAFLAAHDTIRLIAFNGKTAAELYRRHVLPDLSAVRGFVATQILPSTSPAHAAMSFAEKLERWADVLAHHSRAGTA